MAFNGVAAFTQHVESVFEQYPVDNVIQHKYSLLEGVKTLEACEKADFASWENGDACIDAHIDTCDKTPIAGRLVYISGRLGFRETQYSITAAIQVLAAVNTISWNLMTLSHELMHAHVRGLLNTIFSEPVQPGGPKQFEGYFEKYWELVNQKDNHPQRPKLIESLRNIVLYYATNISYFERASKAQKFVRADKGVPESSRSVFLDFKKHYRSLNEMVVHVLDFHYFYGCDEETYLALLWKSWGNVPVVLEDIEHYVLRCIIAITSKEEGAWKDRFDKSLGILKRELSKLLVEASSSAAIVEAHKLLEDADAVNRLRLRFLGTLPLAELAIKFLKCDKVHAALIKDDNVSAGDDGEVGRWDYKIKPGEFPGFSVKSPVAFVKYCLDLALADPLCKISDSHFSAWIFSACASAIDSN